MKRIFLSLFLLLALALSGCDSEDAFVESDNSGSGDNNIEPNQVVAAELHATSGDVEGEEFPAGLPVQMSATITLSDQSTFDSPNDGSYSQYGYWSLIAGQDIAEIDEQGVLTTSGAGDVTVRLTEASQEKASERYTELDLHIMHAELTQVEIATSAPDDTTPLGIPVQLTAVLSFSNGQVVHSPNDGSFTQLGSWSIVPGQGDDIAQITEQGKLFSSGVGEVTVKLTSDLGLQQSVEKVVAISDATALKAQLIDDIIGDEVPVGVPVQFSAKVLFSDRHVYTSPNDGTYSSLGSWSVVEGGAIASIDELGLLTTTGSGSVKVRLTETGGEGRTIEKSIYVTDAELMRTVIVSNPHRNNVPAGIPVQMSALMVFNNGTYELSPNDGSQSDLGHWSVSLGGDIASINETGLLTTTAPGEVTIKLENDDGEVETSLTVTDARVTDVAVISDAEDDTAPAGVPIQMSAEFGYSDGSSNVSPNDGTYSDLGEWNITQGGDIATITSTGLVETTGPGSVTVQLSGQGPFSGYKEKTLTIEDAIVTDVELTSDAAGDESPAGVPVQMMATANFSDASTVESPNDGTYSALGYWSLSSGADYAQISATGLVESEHAGRVTVRLTDSSDEGAYVEKDITFTTATIDTASITTNAPGDTAPAGVPIQFTGHLEFSNGGTLDTPNDGTLSSMGHWSIESGADIATITPTGWLETTNQGLVTVRLFNFDESQHVDKTVRITHAVVTNTEITTPGDETEFDIESPVQLGAEITFTNEAVKYSPNDGSFSELGEWSIANGADIAAITDTGEITATQTGNVTVRLTSKEGDFVDQELSFIEQAIVPVRLELQVPFNSIPTNYEMYLNPVLFYSDGSTTRIIDDLEVVSSSGIAMFTANNIFIASASAGSEHITLRGTDGDASGFEASVDVDIFEPTVTDTKVVDFGYQDNHNSMCGEMNVTYWELLAAVQYTMDDGSVYQNTYPDDGGVYPGVNVYEGSGQYHILWNTGTINVGHDFGYEYAVYNFTRTLEVPIDERETITFDDATIAGSDGAAQANAFIDSYTDEAHWPGVEIHDTITSYRDYTGCSSEHPASPDSITNTEEW